MIIAATPFDFKSVPAISHIAAVPASRQAAQHATQDARHAAHEPHDATEPLPIILDAYEPSPAEEALYLAMMADDEARDALVSDLAELDMRETIDSEFYEAFRSLDSLHDAEFAESGMRGRRDSNYSCSFGDIH